MPEKVFSISCDRSIADSAKKQYQTVAHELRLDS